MAQATGTMSFRGCVIEGSVNGSSWTDISGWSSSLKIDGGERAIGEFFTLDGDTPIITAGKRSSFELTVAVVYTEGASDPFEVLRAAYEAGSAYYIRWEPKGNVTGNFRFTSDQGIVMTPAYPAGEASSPDAIAIEFKVKVKTITKSVIP